MSELTSETGQKRLLENPFVGNLIVPIAIVLIGALIIFGVTKLLSTERSHRDLVREMRSKTFGNRWIAAYELSKFISSSSIPKEDIPWMIENLAIVMQEAKEPRTRKFIVAAVGAMRNSLALPIIHKALNDLDSGVQFHAIVALSHMPSPIDFDWKLLEGFLESPDLGFVQVTLLTLATHRVLEGRGHLLRFVNHQDRSVRFSAATGLINYREKGALPVLKEILFLVPSNRPDQLGFNAEKVEKLKLNVLVALYRNQWGALNPILNDVVRQEPSLKVVGKIKEILNELKLNRSPNN